VRNNALSNISWPDMLLVAGCGVVKIKPRSSPFRIFLKSKLNKEMTLIKRTRLRCSLLVPNFIEMKHVGDRNNKLFRNP
jgi:hypothetical protein